MRVAEVKKRRGGPSGNLSHDFVTEECNLWIAERRGQDVTALKARLELMRLRERMLERKRDELARAKIARRPSIKGKINRARQQPEYIRQHEEQRARWALLETDFSLSV
jgi:hypothetical protein